MRQFVRSVPEAITCLHGDMHIGNVITDGMRDYWIDLGDFAYGNPLFLPEADYLHLLYAYDYPTFTFNRAYYPGEPYIAYDVNYYLPQLPASFITGILSDMLYQDYMNPAFASIELSPEYDVNSRELKINVSGETLAEAEAIYGDIALTVLLTEDEVKSMQAVYNEVTQRTYTQKEYAMKRPIAAKKKLPLRICRPL